MIRFSKGSLLPIAAGLSLLPAIALAQDDASTPFVSNAAGIERLLENPYVNLYVKRLEVGRLEVQRQASIAENERVKWVRVSGLADQGAVPRADADAQQTAFLVATKKVEVAKAKVSKADALLSIARQRTQAGLDMPVCSTQN